MDKLARYRDKRRFDRTAEPAGRPQAARAAKGDATGRFVIHKHAARRLHYDLRLELDGVYVSWAVPKGFDPAPGERRLAVHVEDHPLEYGRFEGTIPTGEYGAGTVMLWDRGTWRLRGGDGAAALAAGKLDFKLEGERLRGRWTLVRTRMGRGKADEWLLLARSGAADRGTETGAGGPERSVASGRTMEEIAAGLPAKAPSTRPAPLPREITPALATRVARPPSGDRWLHEIKLDGYRLLARLEGGGVRLLTRNGRDWTDRLPALAQALGALPARSALLDGELVALDAQGRTRFGRLQDALAAGRTAGLVYQAFDLLHLDGMDLTDARLVERKDRLRSLLATPPPGVRYLDHLDVEGSPLLEEACRLGLEGIVSKRRDAPYRPGRGRSWLKSRCQRQDEFVVGGFTEQVRGGNAIGALLLGERRERGLAYVGKVGTGFDARTRRRLRERLDPLLTGASPFTAPCEGAGAARWVRPVLVVDIAYAERTDRGRLRHPIYRGLREDKTAAELACPVPTARPARSRGGTVTVAGVRLTHPDRVLYPRQGLTKRALAEYLAAAAEHLLARLARRPLALLRCPAGRTGECFFQKRPGSGLPPAIRTVRIPGEGRDVTGLYVDSPAGLVSLAQIGALELHPWGARVEDLERPDVLVFDLDPDEGLPWERIVVAGHALAERLEGLGLAVFWRLTGGKGLHLVVPLEADRPWPVVKAFTRAVAHAQARDAPGRYAVKAAKAARRGRIFIDYLRNGRGATAIASYSTRARPGAPVAVPVRRDELRRAGSGARYDVASVPRRLAALGRDPWADFEAARAPLTGTMLRAVGLSP